MNPHSMEMLKYVSYLVTAVPWQQEVQDQLWVCLPWDVPNQLEGWRAVKSAIGVQLEGHAGSRRHLWKG